MCEPGSPGLAALLLDLDNTLVDTRGADAAACHKVLARGGRLAAGPGPCLGTRVTGIVPVCRRGEAGCWAGCEAASGGGGAPAARGTDTFPGNFFCMQGSNK